MLFFSSLFNNNLNLGRIESNYYTKENIRTNDDNIAFKNAVDYIKFLERKKIKHILFLNPVHSELNIEKLPKVTNEFLEWCKKDGNDLITPHPEFGFPGLKDGDSWCVCASSYARSLEAGKACPIFIKKTHENTLKIIPIEQLKKFAIDLS